MRYKANGYRHVGSDLPLTPPDAGLDTVDCHVCGETFIEDSDDLASVATCTVIADLLGERDGTQFCRDCVDAEIESHPRGATVQANLT